MEQTKSLIAVATKESTDLTGLMVVVNVQPSLSRRSPANSAATPLLLEYAVVVLRSNAVLLLEHGLTGYSQHFATTLSVVPFGALRRFGLVGSVIGPPFGSLAL
jgi:hypothetical protein